MRLKLTASDASKRPNVTIANVEVVFKNQWRDQGADERGKGDKPYHLLPRRPLGLKSKISTRKSMPYGVAESCRQEHRADALADADDETANECADRVADARRKRLTQRL